MGALRQKASLLRTLGTLPFFFGLPHFGVVVEEDMHTDVLSVQSDLYRRGSLF